MRYDNEDIKIIKKILSEEKLDGKEKINELRAQIYEELHKPDDEMDCDLIDENIRTLFLLEGGEYDDHVDAEAGLEKARKRAKAAQPKLKRILQYKFMKPVLAACFTLVFLFSANVVSVHATGNSLLDNVVLFGKNYIGFDFSKSESQTSTSPERVNENDDLYQELIKKCKESGLSPLLPEDLPENFEILNFEQESLTKRQAVTITLGSNKDSLLFNIDYYSDKNAIPIIKMPNASGVNKIEINDIDVYLSNESDKISSIFNSGNYVYKISSTLSYDETVQILDSLK